MQHAGFEKADTALEYIFGGSAVFTMTSEATGKHFSFFVQKGKDEGAPYFAKVLRGPNNAKWGGDWMYLGFIKEGTASLIAGNKGLPAADSYKALDWALSRLSTDAMPAQLKIQHEGSCSMCSKPLTDPVSVELGIGPVCRAKGM